MRPIAYDVETTGLRLHDGHEMFAWSTCDEKGEGVVKRLDSPSSPFKLQPKIELGELRAFVEEWLSGAVAPVMHNAKFDLTATENKLGFHIAEKIKFHCTYLQACVVRNNFPSNELKKLAFTYAGIPMDDEAEVKRFTKATGTDYSEVPEDLMTAYQARDALRAILLHLFFYPKICENPQWLEIYESELQTAIVTMRMQERGVMIRRPACVLLIEELRQAVDDALVEAADLVGKPVSLAGDELLWLLFTKLRLPVLKRTGVRNQPSTAKEVMQELREHPDGPFPIIDVVMKYRSYVHGASILQSYLDYANEDGIIHPSINSCRAVTARQSCKEPNLHNVAKTRVLLNPFPVPARRVFCPRPGYVNIHIDFSGIELRILIHYCAVYVGKDEILWAVIEQDGDLHYPACKIFYPEYDQMPLEVQKPTRDAVKNANFAGAYGAGDPKMCRTVGLSPEEGIPRIARWRECFPALAGLSRVLGRQATSDGFVTTSFGRRLYLRKTHASVNTLVQGTAAEVMKRAENRVHAYLEAVTSGELKILLSIHDELILECPRKRLGDARMIMPEIAKQMTAFPQISVPLKVDAKVATYNWEKTTPFSMEG